MREYLFRGKRKDNGEWVKGYLYVTQKGQYEISRYSESYDCERFTAVVIPETVGQYTGLKDMNGKKIFEGDIHKFSDFFVVQFGMYIDCDTDIQGYGFYLRNLKTNYCYSFDATENEYINIVGNIHDNRELLKEGDDK